MTSALSLLAEPHRMEILRAVWLRELSAGDIARRFRVTFGAVSQHLRRLTDAGLLRRRREGRLVFYAAEREAMGPLAAALEAMWSEKLDILKNLAEAEQKRIGRGRIARRKTIGKDKR